jgi:hypothetical protein
VSEEVGKVVARIEKVGTLPFPRWTSLTTRRMPVEFGPEQRDRPQFRIAPEDQLDGGPPQGSFTVSLRSLTS